MWDGLGVSLSLSLFLFLSAPLSVCLRHLSYLSNLSIWTRAPFPLTWKVVLNSLRRISSTQDSNPFQRHDDVDEPLDGTSWFKTTFWFVSYLTEHTSATFPTRCLQICIFFLEAREWEMLDVGCLFQTVPTNLDLSNKRRCNCDVAVGVPAFQQWQRETCVSYMESTHSDALFQ